MARFHGPWQAELIWPEQKGGYSELAVMFSSALRFGAHQMSVETPPGNRLGIG